VRSQTMDIRELKSAESGWTIDRHPILPDTPPFRPALPRAFSFAFPSTPRPTGNQAAANHARTAPLHRDFGY
jgi:hypothetical protein